MIIIWPLARVSCSLLVASYGAITVASSNFFPDLSWNCLNLTSKTKLMYIEHFISVMISKRSKLSSFNSFVPTFSRIALIKIFSNSLNCKHEGSLDQVEMQILQTFFFSFLAALEATFCMRVKSQELIIDISTRNICNTYWLVQLTSIYNRKRKRSLAVTHLDLEIIVLAARLWWWSFLPSLPLSFSTLRRWRNLHKQSWLSWHHGCIGNWRKNNHPKPLE